METIVKYSLISDLHQNHPQPKIIGLEDNVIIAGDLNNGLGGLKYIKKLENKGHNVFAVDGNHEHYANDTQRRTIPETEERFYQDLTHPYRWEIEPGLTVLGVNGWYYVEDNAHWLGYMNDGRYAGSSMEVNAQADSHLVKLRTMLDEVEGKAIVVTHTAPCYETLDPRFEGSKGNPYYVNQYMSYLMNEYSDKITVWHHGHTHYAMDKVVHGVRVITNPRGYPGENPLWKPLTVEIENGSVRTPA